MSLAHALHQCEDIPLGVLNALWNTSPVSPVLGGIPLPGEHCAGCGGPLALWSVSCALPGSARRYCTQACFAMGEDQAMPVHTQKDGKRYRVVDDKGRVYGSHATKEKANEQTTAVNIHMGYVPGVTPRKRSTK